MSRVLILTRYFEECRRLIDAAGLPGVEKLAAAKDTAGAMALGDDFDIVFGEPSLVKGLLPRLTNLRWIQSIWAGVEPLLDPAQRRDYLLTNARGVFGGLMSEYVFGYLLMHERRILERFRAQQEKRWERTITGSLRGKTIGLLGVGSIGSALAHTAKFFKMHVHGYTLSSESCPDVDFYFHGSNLEDFASQLNYLVCVLPNTKATRHIVDASLLGALPVSTVFINVGRGMAVNETALMEALQNGRLAMAVLDVFEQEPLPANHLFWTTPNLYMTFHTSAPSLPEDLSRLFIENYRRFESGQPLMHLVDFERGY